jgi:hypothetical protein
MTATIQYTITEKSDPSNSIPSHRYALLCAMPNGFVAHTSYGETRADAIQGLNNYGFTLQGA